MTDTGAPLSLNKPQAGDNAETAITSVATSMQTINDLFNASTGHAHTGATTNGPLIAAAALASDVRPRAHVYNDAAQSIANATVTALNFNAEREDTEGIHGNLVTNLTGTVAKTAGSTALVGTGTAFTTELAVGRVISVPGTAAEVRVVTAIADNTHLTVNTAFANNATGQTATNVNSCLVCRTAGSYDIKLNVEFAGNATGQRAIGIRMNGDNNQIIAYQQHDASASSTTNMHVSVEFILAQWDYVEAIVYQTSTGALNVNSTAKYSPEFSMHRVG